MIRCIQTTLFYFAIASQLCIAKLTQLTDVQSQKTITAEVINLENGILTIKNEQGKVFSLPMDRLDPSSKERAREALKTEKSLVTTEQINTAIGHHLFLDSTSLFSERASEVAKRLKWPKESETSYSSSYRYYPPIDYGFSNAHPYSTVIYGGSKKLVTQLSLIFANKGDYNSTVGSGEDHFTPQGGQQKRPESLSDAIDLDHENISQALTKVLGESITQRFGETGQRRYVSRWDWNEHSLLLESEDEEYVALSIMTTHAADNDGQTERIADTDLKERLLSNLAKESNGDIYIKNIPMVDQGPKGYCAPATFERCMRYMSVPADMYLLATIATAEGGGTNTQLLASEAKRQIRRKARRISDINLVKDLKSMRGVKRYIDRGIPIMWCMRSVPRYNKIANEHTVTRKKTTDWVKWAATIAPLADQFESELAEENAYHICMIIGYNELTDEIAVSDSWGPSYALRWAPRAVCQAVTYGEGFIINP